MKVLFVTPWNNSNPAAYIAREHIRTHTDDDFVVLCPGQESWAEDFDLPADRVRVHTFGETLHFEDGESHTYDPQMHQLDFVLIQLVFYCKTYNVDKVIVFGTLFSVFEIVARIRLMKNANSSQQPFEVPVRAVLTSFGTCTSPDVPATMYTETFADVVESMFVLVNSEDNRLHDLFVVTADENPNFPTVHEFTPTYTSDVSVQAGRAALESTVGLRLPAQSTVVLSLNPTTEQARMVVNAAREVFEIRPDLMISDALLFWIVQFAPGSDDLVQTIQTSPYATHILYTGSKMMSEAVAAIHDSADVMVLSDPYFNCSVKYTSFDVVERGSFTHHPVISPTAITRRILQLLRGAQPTVPGRIQALPDFARA
jgi:hypothetical protein